MGCNESIRWLGRIPALRYAFTFFTLSLACLALLQGMGWLLNRGGPGPLPNELRDPSIREHYDAQRQARLDTNQPPLAWLEVDYQQGDSAAWWPKGESPFLRERVDAGELPPVAERVGPEPVVYRGADGAGRYGGDWWRLATTIDDVRVFLTYVGALNTFYRVTPFGEATRPHLARRLTPSDDYTVWTVELRRGVRWSDGHPFTADDFVFWWNDVVNDPANGLIPETMRVEGEPGTLDRVDDYTLRYRFPKPNPGFAVMQTTAAAALHMPGPAHYLRQFHPKYGDSNLIARIAAENKIRPEQVVRLRSSALNPERPSLAPWILRTYRNNGPWTLVRNPYYFAVDAQGNQLPYLDRIVFRQVSKQLLNKTLLDGDVSFDSASDVNYASLMKQRSSSGYDVRHWNAGGAAGLCISVNRMLPVRPDDPTSTARRDLLRNPEFRRALSIAVNRQRFIDAVYMGIGTPGNPGPAQGEFGYDPHHLNVNAEFDPDRANAMLDQLGLTRRDEDGFRTLPDGSRLLFRLIGMVDMSPMQFVREDWARIGLRVIPQQRPHRLMLFERTQADLVVSEGASAYSWTALGAGDPYFNWYHRGGLYGDPEALAMKEQPGAQEIELMRKGQRATVTPDTAERDALLADILAAARTNVWIIGFSSQSLKSSEPVVVKKGLRGVPENLFSAFYFLSPNNAVFETWFWENPDTVNGKPATADYLAERARSIRSELAAITLPQQQTSAQGEMASSGWSSARSLQLFYALLIVGFLGWSALRHPFVLRRLAIMIPTLGVISIIVYAGIQLPPGSYLETRIIALEEQGLRDQAEQEVRDLRERFHLDEHPAKNYCRWIGLLWFTSFQPEDKGLLQGYMGLSMVTNSPVNDLIGDRVLLTFIISLGTVILTWIVAIPIGIYSAVRQYSVSDYTLTILGFLGMCIPNFIFALLLMLLSRVVFGDSMTGLFSDQFAMQAHWDWPKFLDLLKHIWIPLIVIGLGGTAGMIRVLRANLLDELKRPYVVTARAKGVRPVRLLFKYPVRLALIPFISGIGGLLPGLISGGAMVSIIMSLPTIGPMLLDAVMVEDLYMAGSLLFLLSALSVVGVLFSDLMLMLVDPRIRMSGGSR